MLLGVPRLAVAMLALIAVPLSLLQHANLELPRGVDRCLRWVLVSPVLHRTHHSGDVTEADSNYGSVFNFADRLFGTFRLVERADLRFGDARR